ncbi:MAG: hypothetical protein WC321_05640 [Candidatus Omnitrophota bacterium]|jgi:rubrerythrin
MISIDFSLAIGLYIFLFISVILAAWLTAKKEKDRDLPLDGRFIWFCSICAYTYINTAESLISVCPRCGSYNKKTN